MCCCQGGHAWLLGGACMAAGGWGACVVAGGRAWLLGGHAWLPGGGVCGCQGVGMRGCQGGVRGCRGGSCVATGGCVLLPGGVRGCRGACMATGGRAWLRGVPCDTHTPPCGQTDTCKNITFANFVCGR